jgi:hypothetical protein
VIVTIRARDIVTRSAVSAVAETKPSGFSEKNCYLKG